MKIYNSINKKKEDFVPIDSSKVTMYVCGPTLYGDIHIGNARPIIFFDTVYRFLKKQNINIIYASNITDIDDKIINKAKELNITEEELIKINYKEFKSILNSLNILEVDYMPKVTEYINEIINFIDELLKKNFAYKTPKGDIYFKIDKISDYGKISNRKIEDLIAGSRVEVNDQKENKLDFALWKKTDVGIVFEAPFGKGRPGWHTECVSMIKEIFGEKIDIHGGGMDLKFPHHENENAQSCAYDNHDIANYWIHNGFVNIENEKMSKSLNNFITVKEMLKEYNSNIIRLLLLQTNYRQPINLNEEFIKQTISLNFKIENFTNSIFNSDYEKYKNEKLNDEIIIEMEDNFNTPNVISKLLEIIKKKDIKGFITTVDLLGLKYNYVINEEDLDQNIKIKFLEAKKLTKEKKFDDFDKIKESIKKSGYELFKTRDGLIIKKGNHNE